ncbi:Farnesol dehydrogenase [Blattella germanica]|nr:Farnesol dehydrogenase [Blattella germanica]
MNNFFLNISIAVIMERWQGRVAVVTGASSGIGAAIAEELVKKGLNVVGLARRVERIRDLATSLLREAGKLHAFRCDVSREEEVKTAFEWVKYNLGGVDILVNNAGCVNHHSLIEGPMDAWREIMDLNVLGLCMCTQQALQIMKENEVNDGHIIHINSIYGHYTPSIDYSCYVYAASKHAVTALTEGLRRELLKEKSKIRISSISPGLVETELIPHQLLKGLVHLQPKDVADCVVYVLGAPPHVQVHELTVRPVGDVL